MDRVEPNLTPSENAALPTPAVEQIPISEELLAAGKDEERISVASNWTLVWWRFRKNKLAVVSTVILLFLMLIVLIPEFFATVDPEQTDARLAFIPVQGIHWLDNGQLKPWVPGVAGKRDPVTLKMIWTTDETQKIYVRFFAPGFSYKLLGLIETDRHLVGAVDAEQADLVYLLGTDRLGRDQWSRLAYATRISMTIGMVSVILSVVLGLLLGGISGYFGGWPDLIIQRLIE